MIEDLVRHVLHFIHKGGEDCVGIGFRNNHYTRGYFFFFGNAL